MQAQPLSPRSRSLLLPALVAALAFSCHSHSGGSGGGGTNQPTGEIDVGFTQSVYEGIGAFHITLSEIELLDADGQASALLAQPLAIELIGLQDKLLWVGRRELPAGSYVAARVRFAPDSAAANKKGGAPLAIEQATDELLLPFATPLELEPQGYRNLGLSIDLANSLSASSEGSIPPDERRGPDPSTEHESLASLRFDPLGEASSGDGSSAQWVDDLAGAILTLDQAARSLVVEASVGNGAHVDLGELHVRTDAATLILDEAGATRSFDDLLDWAILGQSRIELRGQLAGGELLARQIELEDRDGDGRSAHPVRIEGIVLGHELGRGFELSVLELEKGAELAEPVLATLADPHRLSLLYDAGTQFIEGRSGTLRRPESLQSGQRVEVDFAQFLSSPFQAARVELEDLWPRCDVALHALRAETLDALVRVLPGEAVLGQQVADSQTDVEARLVRARVLLLTQGTPALDPLDLKPGLELELQGEFSGSPSAPVLDVSRLWIHPGHLDGARVLAIDRAHASFSVEGGVLVHPFGEGVEAGTLRVHCSPDIVVEKGQEPLASFFDRFESLSGSEQLHVDLEGLAGSGSQAIVAYELRSRVQR